MRLSASPGTSQRWRTSTGTTCRRPVRGPNRSWRPMVLPDLAGSSVLTRPSLARVISQTFAEKNEQEIVERDILGGRHPGQASVHAWRKPQAKLPREVCDSIRARYRSLVRSQRCHHALGRDSRFVSSILRRLPVGGKSFKCRHARHVCSVFLAEFDEDAVRKGIHDCTLSP